MENYLQYSNLNLSLCITQAMIMTFLPSFTTDGLSSIISSFKFKY